VSFNEQLTDLSRQFKEACDAQDWERLKALDVLMRDRLQTLVSDAKTPAQRVQLEKWLRRIQNIYRLVLKDAAGYREQVAAELKQLSREQKAIASYEKSSRL